MRALFRLGGLESEAVECKRKALRTRPSSHNNFDAGNGAARIICWVLVRWNGCAVECESEPLKDIPKEEPQARLVSQTGKYFSRTM